MAVKSAVIVFSIIFIVGCHASPRGVSPDFFSNVDHPGRIVGGSVASPGSYPHMAALTNGLFFRSVFCGGSIIATRTVLTAAHCIDTVFQFGFLSRTLRVVVGTNTWNQGGQYYTVSGNVTHKHWTDNLVKNDIGILHTASAIVYNDFVKPIPVSYNYVQGGVLTKTAGWGRTSFYGPTSTQLLELVLSTISAEQCTHDVLQASATLNSRSPTYEPKIELCTFHSPGRGLCRGDSGSALSLLDRGYQVGIVSWGFPCARGAPDVHVRLSAYEAWIQKYTRF